MLWLLKPRTDLAEHSDPWEPWCDKAFGFVVRAETEIEARLLADDNSGSERSGIKVPVAPWRFGDRPWLKPEFSTCVPLEADGKCEVILRDYLRG